MAGTLIPAHARAPRVCLYRGLGRVMERSGVGSAMRHQASMLRAAGTALVGSWERPDVVQLNTVLPDTPLVALLARARGIPVVLYAHSTRQDFEQSWRGSKWLAPWFERWLRLVYRCGDVVVTPTPYSKRIIDGEAPARTARGRALAEGHDLRVVAGELSGIHAALLGRPVPAGELVAA